MTLRPVQEIRADLALRRGDPQAEYLATMRLADDVEPLLDRLAILATAASPSVSGSAFQSVRDDG